MATTMFRLSLCHRPTPREALLLLLVLMLALVLHGADLCDLAWQAWDAWRQHGLQPHEWGHRRWPVLRQALRGLLAGSLPGRDGYAHAVASARTALMALLQPSGTFQRRLLSMGAVGEGRMQGSRPLPPLSGAMTMNAQQTMNASLWLLPALAGMLVVQACGGGFDANAQVGADPYEGLWDAQVTQRDCASGAVVGNFRRSQLIHRGGTLSDTDVTSPTTRGPGFGTWTRIAPGFYSVRFRFFRYNADGSLAGTHVFNSTRALSGDGLSYEGNTRAEIRDLSGNVLTAVCVTDLGTRFR